MSIPEILLWVALLMVMPLAVHLGALGGADLVPAKLRGASRAERRLFQYAYAIIFLNSAAWTATFLTWRFGTGTFWLIPMCLALPFTLMQMMLMVLAKRRYFREH